ncbi:hypothetical protein [Geoalkalibacter sp.]|uniref:hypothetical protein n=1 Tax=Geoalkalibacter sp. TaxID=3041440 RepID=UPI00272E4071|nr:hypothetical protein [Geoalkalibacter sp.]
MTKGRGIGWWLLAAMLLWIPGPAWAADVLNMSGEYLSEDEMAATHGGFSLPNGDFLYFSMDFMRVNLVSHQQPGGGETTGFVNALRQEAVIAKDGSIQLNLDILQAGQGGDPLTSQTGRVPQQINNVLLNNAFTDFQGIANANIISGNYNVGSIVNIINLKLGFFSAENFGGAQLREFFLY